MSNKHIDTCYRKAFEKICEAKFNKYGLAKVGNSAMQNCIDAQFGGLTTTTSVNAVSLSMFTVMFAAVLILFASKRQTISRRRDNLVERDEYSFRVFV